MVLTDGEQLVLTPTYHVFEMNKGHHDAASLEVHLQAPATTREVGDDQLETLSMSASVKNDTVLISLTNLDAERPVSLEFDLRGRRVGATTARILTAETLQSHNKAGTETTVGVRDFDGVAAAGTGLRVELPAHAFVTISAPL
jgi:alpha-N-arabinofuranosidase